MLANANQSLVNFLSIPFGALLDSSPYPLHPNAFPAKRDQKFGLQLNASLILSLDSAARRQSPDVANGWQYLLKVDYAEQAVRILVRARGEEQLIGLSVHASASPESDRPKLVNLYRLSRRILEWR
jgi:hypothetical protein